MFIAIHPETGARAPIEPRNVITCCPVCHKEYAVNLVALIRSNPDFDLICTSMLCEDCAAIAKQMQEKYSRSAVCSYPKHLQDNAISGD